MHRSFSEKVIDGVFYFILLIIGIVMIYPFWNILVLSLNDSLDALRKGIYLWPRAFTLQNYIFVFNGMENLGIGFRNSVLRTVVGVICSMTAVSMLAYTINRKNYIFAKFIQRMMVITMYVSGGLIPVYLVVISLGLRNNFLVYILPMLVSAYYVLIFRSYLEGIPDSLNESAEIDGANDLYIYLFIIMPICKPVIAALTLFMAVDQWNAWFDTFIYTDGKRLATLQYILMQILNQSTSSIRDIDEARQKLMNQQSSVITPESIRMALTIIATLPILMVYPFIQKYFVSGITLGSVKE